jgi:NAD(P)H dehydrogenase (quinone)
MKILLVTSHPECRSFSGAMVRVVEESLRTCRHTIRTIDLQAENFDPVLRASQFSPRKDAQYFEAMAEQAYQAELGESAEDIRRHQDLLLWADSLILQFPLWWWSLPALMKGWVDRVFSNGFAYGSKNLSPRTAMVCVTAETKSEKFSSPPDTHPLQHIERGMLKFCGFRILPAFVVSDVWSIGQAERERKLNELGLHLAEHFPAEP